MKSKSTKSHWSDLLQVALKDRETRPMGPGWQTFDEIQAELGLGSNRTHRLLRQWVASGDVEVFTGTRLNANGILVRERWYRRVRK